MTITVAGTATAVPGVGVTVTAGATITAIQLFRTASGVTELTRVQPRPGHSTVYVEDYELPWDVPVTYKAVYTASGSFTDTATPVTVSSTSAWAIHPVFPSSLSVQLDRPGGTGETWVISIGTATRAANSSTHLVIGSAYPVVVTTGPRLAGTGTAVIGTASDAAEGALWALLDDQSPILLRVPDSFGANFANGFYSIGDVAADRIGVASLGLRQFTLPLTRVAAPAVTQQLAWDYPSLTAAFADYGALTAAFADYGSLTADRQVS